MSIHSPRLALSATKWGSGKKIGMRAEEDALLTLLTAKFQVRNEGWAQYIGGSDSSNHLSSAYMPLLNPGHRTAIIALGLLCCNTKSRLTSRLVS